MILPMVAGYRFASSRMAVCVASRPQHFIPAQRLPRSSLLVILSFTLQLTIHHRARSA